MSTHRINFAPASWRSPTPPAWISLAATAALALILITAGLALSPTPRVAEATPLTVSAPPEPSPPAETIRMALDHPGYWPLWRASWYLPWDRLCADLFAGMPSGARFTELRYTGNPRLLEISGEISEVALLPGLMVRLSDIPWLGDPDPFRVELDPATSRTQFTLRLAVLPYLEIREATAP